MNIFLKNVRIVKSKQLEDARCHFLNSYAQEIKSWQDTEATAVLIWTGCTVTYLILLIRTNSMLLSTGLLSYMGACLYVKLI